MMKKQDLVRGVAAIEWWHSIDLGQGVVTPGRKHTVDESEHWQIPDAVIAGKTVLDVGAWDGYYSFYAERHGARRVLAIDRPAWTKSNTRVEHYGRCAGKAGFDFARRALGSRVESKVLDVHSVNAARIGVFDTVFFFGVYYHLLDPFAALTRVSRVAREYLLVEGHVHPFLPQDQPVVMFYGHGEHRGDTTTYFAPTPACVVAWLEWCGFGECGWRYTWRDEGADRQKQIDATRALFIARRTRATA